MYRNILNLCLWAAFAPAVLLAAYMLFRWYVPPGSYHDKILKGRKKLLWSIAAGLGVCCVIWPVEFSEKENIVLFLVALAVFAVACWRGWRLVRALRALAGASGNGDTVQPDTPLSRCVRILKITFISLRILVFAGIVLLAAMVQGVLIHEWVSPGYTDFREPDPVETVTIDGFTVKMVRWKSANPVKRIFDWMFLRLRYKAFADTLGNKVNYLQIDLSLDEEKGREIEKRWAEYEANARLPRDDPKWDFDKQVIYNYLKDFPEKGKAYAEECLRNTLEHELQHARDSVSGAARFDKEAFRKAMESAGDSGWIGAAMEFTPARAHDEKRAYLAALMRSRSAIDLVFLRAYLANKHDGNVSIAGYEDAAKSILSEMGRLTGSKPDKDLAFVPVSEINKAAAGIFAQTP